MAESTTHIIQYLADLKDVKSKLKEINNINKSLSKEFGSDYTKAVKIISSSVGKLSQKPIKLKGGQQGIQTLQKFNTVVKLADGSLKTVSQTVRRVNGVFKGFQTTVSSGAKTTRGFGANLATLVKRASLTIPVWFLLRGSITAVFGAIKAGLNSLVEFDRSLQKAKRNLTGSAKEIEANFRELRIEVQKLSLEAGISVTKVTNAFQRFATVGFDFETSMAGATQATKLAVSVFGDTETNANALAIAFRLLQDKSEGAEKPAVQLAKITAQLADLWTDNAFKIDEMAGALQRFSPIANTTNTSMHETIAVLATLATAGIKGTRAGRLLGSAFLKLDKNFEKINSTLGLQINPQLTTTFDRFRLVIKEISKLEKVNKLGASKAVQELFGGVRSSQTTQALIAVGDLLDENLARTGDVAKFERSFLSVTDTLAKQVDIFKEQKDAINRSFVTGLVGGNDFKDSMKELNKILEDSRDGFREFAQIVSQTFRGGFFVPTILAVQSLDAKKQASRFASNLHDEIQLALISELESDKIFEVFEKAVQASFDNTAEISDQTLGQLLSKFDEALAKKNPVKIPGEVVLGDTDDESFTNQQKVIELIVKRQLDALKTQGASNAQLKKAEGLYNKQLGFKEDIISKLGRELQLEKDIGNERRLQNDLSSESLKLFRIAQKNGAKTAGAIGDVLSGEVDFGSFIRRGGEAVEVFKKEFAGVFEQQQAKQFFKGDTVSGQPGLRGGSNINIQEKVLQSGIPLFNPKVALDLNSAFKRFAELKFPDQEIDNMIVKSISFPGGTVLEKNLISNADLQSRPSPQNALTNADLRQSTNTPSISVLKIDFGDGKDISLIGTKESITKQIADVITPIVINKSAEILKNNPEHDLTKSVDGRITKF